MNAFGVNNPKPNTTPYSVRVERKPTYTSGDGTAFGGCVWQVALDVTAFRIEDKRRVRNAMVALGSTWAEASKMLDIATRGEAVVSLPPDQSIPGEIGGTDNYATRIITLETELLQARKDVRDAKNQRNDACRELKQARLAIDTLRTGADGLAYQLDLLTKSLAETEKANKILADKVVALDARKMFTTFKDMDASAAERIGKAFALQHRGALRPLTTGGIVKPYAKPDPQAPVPEFARCPACGGDVTTATRRGEHTSPQWSHRFPDRKPEPHVVVYCRTCSFLFAERSFRDRLREHDSDRLALVARGGLPSMHPPAARTSIWPSVRRTMVLGGVGFGAGVAAAIAALYALASSL